MTASPGTVPRPWLQGADIDLSLDALQGLYASGQASVLDVVSAVRRALAALPQEAGVFISVSPAEQLEEAARRLDARGATAELPLFGVPFAVKDNIDVAGVATTAACPDFAYQPARSARVVELLVRAGAVYVGKTNLDQFATGLSGVRSPYGAPASAYHPEYISGGSSSGSAVAVAANLVSFALGTDTGGSGRIPAGFNHVVGLKPSLGRLSTRGVLPNCQSLDCVSIFARSLRDATSVFESVDQHDVEDPFSRRSVADSAAPASLAGAPWGIPRAQQLEFFGDAEAEAVFHAAVARLRASGVSFRELDFAPYLEAGALLFEGPHVAERLTAIGEFVHRRPEALHPVTRQIFEGSSRFTAADAFAAQHRQRVLTLRVAADFAGAAGIAALLVPTAPRAYTLREMLAAPIELNTRLGHYSYFVNLLDLCAVAVPNGFSARGVPHGVTLIAPREREQPLLALAALVSPARAE